AGIIDFSEQEATIKEIVDYLKEVYCNSVAVEFTYIKDNEEKEWFRRNYEKWHKHEISSEHKCRIMEMLIKSQTFDQFLAKKFPSVKRYGGEGAESMMVFFDEVFNHAMQDGIENVIISMPHRGRLNFMTGLLHYQPAAMFSKMMGRSELPPSAKGTGDVLSHLFKTIDLTMGDSNLHLSLLPNPSHLEACNPVACGKTRARQLSIGDADYSESGLSNKTMCLQVHGDASFAGQGIIPETLMLSEVPHFRTGGSIHLIVNNQIGFTTEPERGRSSLYSSDVGKIIDCPVIHVNGDNPEDLARATKLALLYKQKFAKDIIIDLICFRLWGHNEMDEPAFTQPIMYNAIYSKKSVPDSYAENLEDDKIISNDRVTALKNEYTSTLNSELKNVEKISKIEMSHLQKQWSGYVQASHENTTWDTGCDLNTLLYVGAKSVEVPESMTVHPRLQRTFIENRFEKLKTSASIDWATAEALAFGTLLFQGYNVRISGQDVGRGTFSHRHVMLVDQKTDEVYIPLNNIAPDQKGFIEIANSTLSEEAVLGFEYGMSIESPRNLVIWEAQFGDFFNGAQIIIDAFITSGETKWLLQSGLVMLLPHGYDGAGPEHTSCRIERFLQLCDSKEDQIDGDDVNIGIVHPTTPAQYYHLLRRQMLRNFRKPLIVASPKILLRYPDAVSTLTEMTPSTFFQPVLGDHSVSSDKVERVILCSGKHYYALDKQRQSLDAKNVAIIRLESLCPFPTQLIEKELSRYKNAKVFIWSQEEHQNMGPWSFVAPRFEKQLGVKLLYTGREALACPAVGIGAIHKEENAKILNTPFEMQ
ncbi:uncharacterized protein TRIADDRAFT_19360, partial [Trichoplax adhaerens]